METRTPYTQGLIDALDLAEQVIDSFLQEQPEKPMQGLEEEIERYLHSLGVGYGGWVDGMDDDDLRGIARHFYDLGCRRTAEKYNEIEYNRQRAEEDTPNDLEEAADNHIRKDALMEWLKERYNSTISNVGCYTGHSVWAEVIEKLESL